MVNKPKKVDGLVPAKNGDKVGVANKKEEKFFVLDSAYLNIWLLCDGNRSEEEIADAFMELIRSKSEDVSIKQDELLNNVKQVLKRLKKFGLIE